MRQEFFKLEAEEFRRKAARCRELLQSFTQPQARADLEAAADGWSTLAYQRELESKRAEVASSD